MVTQSPSAPDKSQLPLVQEYLRRRLNGQPVSPELLEVWRAFYLQYSGMIRRFAAACGAMGESLEDCVQETWINIVERFPDFAYDPSRGCFETWLYTVVRRRAVDLRRRTRRHMLASLDQVSEWQLGASGSNGIDDREWLAAMLAALRQRVSEASYQVFHLRRIDGLCVAEVAHLTNLSPSQVRARHCRVEQKLRKLASRRELSARAAETVTRAI